MNNMVCYLNPNTVFEVFINMQVVEVYPEPSQNGGNEIQWKNQTTLNLTTWTTKMRS